MSNQHNSDNTTNDISFSEQKTGSKTQSKNIITITIMILVRRAVIA